jgi:CheY-like chemotaxis protein
MDTTRPSTRVLLLVEDNPADADLVQEYLQDQPGPYDYEVYHETHLAEAVQRLGNVEVDIILLDLRLPDSAGFESVQKVRDAAGDTPIVVLTGTDDEDVALSCIHYGAQDYLCKSEIRAATLRRAIGYAITRLREAQLRDLQETLVRYRTLSSTSTRTSVTATLSGLGALRERVPDIFRGLITSYAELLKGYHEQLLSKAAKPRETMEWLITRLGDAGAGARDLVDVHIAALDEVLKGETEERSRRMMLEGRLLALEMMGLLVDYYRTGARRRPSAGETV